MLRDKDKQLSRKCTALADASLQALQWVNHPDNEAAVGVKRAGLAKSLRKYAVDGRRLAQAASRPMSVAVFGASQAGKSYMVGGFIAPKDNPVKVVFNGGGDVEKLNFLEKVNPQGGVETTGIVTRFSTQPLDIAPKGFPVILRALREADVAKILCNSHLMELGAEWETDRSFDPDRHAREIAGLPRNPQPMAGLAVEEIYELRDYIEQHLNRHPLGKPAAEPYWDALEAAGPYLGAAARATALSPLWGELREFSELYGTLKAALDDLKHPKWIYAPIESILDRSHGVLHAETLYALDAAYADTLEGVAAQKALRTPVAADTGARMDLPRPVVTALAAELRVTLDGRPWDFLEHTDLLDFPGAKSREDSTLAKFLRDPTRNNARAYCYLRGKVAVLFDNYADDLEANALVLAVDDSQGEVKKLPDLVKEWIYRTHGATPAQRAEVSTVSMFFTMMKSDMLFKLDLGADAATSVQNRFKNNFAQYTGWTKEWTPGQTFKNTFLFRNTSFRQPGVIRYSGPWPTSDNGVTEMPSEIDHADEFKERREVFREAFLANALVRDHVGDPETKLAALLELNDGGITCLARSLAPVCDMDLKVRQIEPRKKRLQEHLLDAMREFNESSDVAKRIAERVAKVDDVIENLFQNPDMFGPFIAEFQMRPATISKHYMEFTTKRSGQPQRPGGAGWAASAQRRGPAFGAYALKAWRDGLVERSKDEALASGFNLSLEHVGTIVGEINGYAELTGLEAAIDEAVSQIERARGRPDEIAYRVGMTVAMLINDAVGYLGVRRPQPAASHAPYPNLPEDPRELSEQRGVFFLSWIERIRKAAEDNARGGKGGKVTAEQNAKLSAIIKKIEDEDE